MSLVDRRGNKVLKSSTLPASFLMVALVTGLLLLVPLVAMRVTEEIDWSASDYVVAGLLIFGAGTATVLGARRAGSLPRRIIVVAAAVLVPALTWAQLALGA